MGGSLRAKRRASRSLQPAPSVHYDTEYAVWLYDLPFSRLTVHRLRNTPENSGADEGKRFLF
jgi:hypothetical protein